MPEGIHMPSPLSLLSLSRHKFSMIVLNNEHGSSSSSTSFSSSPAPSSSRTSLHIDTTHMHKSSSAPRRIRFAPLLDPRRAVVVTDDGHELPIKDDTHFPAAASLAVLRKNSLASQTQAASNPDATLEQSTPGSPSTSSGLSSPTDLQTSSSSTRYSPRPPSRSFTVDILKPFKHPPSSNKQRKRKSKALSISSEEILTPGTTKFFRSSSLLSDQDNSKENQDPASTNSHRNSWVGGWGLSRWTSSNPSSSNARTETDILRNNPPLIRSQSVQEEGDRKKHRSSIAAFFSAAPGVSSLAELRSKTKSQGSTTKTSRNTPTTPSASGTSSPASGSTITSGRSATPTLTSALPSSQRAPRHKGARMLNGRIYGAKSSNRISENPFANARDDEPEFVEWGYGGMGSVKGARSAGVVGNNARGAVNWERLLGGSEVTGQVGQSGWMVPGGGRGGAGARRKQDKEGSRERRSGEADEEKGGEDGEEDDGSGLAWIRKRRKMREEKEKKIREEREKQTKESEQAHENALESDSVPTSPSAVGPQVRDSTTQTTIKASVHDGDQSHPGSGKGGRNAADEHGHEQNDFTQNTGTSNVNGHHDHVMKAVAVPMSRPKASSHHRRTSSKGILEDAENGATVATDHHDDGKLKDVSQQESLPPPAGSDSSSLASSVSESSDEEVSDGEDSSEEDQDQNEKRRTAIGAGVEKVTASFRHRSE